MYSCCVLFKAEKEEQAAKEIAAPPPVKTETEYTHTAEASWDTEAAAAPAVVPGAAPVAAAGEPAFPVAAATQDWASAVSHGSLVHLVCVLLLPLPMLVCDCRVTGLLLPHPLLPELHRRLVPTGAVTLPGNLW